MLWCTHHCAIPSSELALASGMNVHILQACTQLTGHTLAGVTTSVWAVGLKLLLPGEPAGEVLISTQENLLDANWSESYLLVV